MEHTKVIIIGAGIAGLAAANTLSMHGIPNIIFEARNRIGGRIHTDFSLGVPISLGAQWMHGTVGNPVKEIADKLNLKYIESGFGHVAIYDQKGQLIPFEKVVDFYETFNKRLVIAKKYARKQDKDISLSQALKETAQVDLVNHSIDDLKSAALMRLSLYSGANLNVLSGRHWDEEIVLAGGNMMMLDGFSPVVDELASRCQCRLNTTVTHIIRKPNRAIVETSRGSWTADYVIITAPLGVLKARQIQFQPELPVAKRRSIEKLAMGVLNSVVLKFPTVFWPAVPGMQFTNRDIQFPIFTNLHSFYNQPILTARLAGESAKKIEFCDEATTIQKVMRDLKKIFGNDIPAPESFIITRWNEDPFAYGSYSFLPVGASGRDLDNISKTVANTLFFAGEATSRDYPGTVHGAYMSGIRAAESLLNLIR